MKVKCGIIYNAIEVISELAEKPMKVSLAAKMLRLSDDLQNENKYIDKQRQDILTKYGSKDENGELIIIEGAIKLEGEDLEKAQNELVELSEVEVEIPDRMITEEELEANNIELNMKQLLVLRNFLHKEENNVEIIE